MAISIMGPRKGTELVGKEWWNITTTDSVFMVSYPADERVVVNGQAVDHHFASPTAPNSGRLYLKMKMVSSLQQIRLSINCGRSANQRRDYVFTRAKLIADGAKANDIFYIMVGFTNLASTANTVTYGINGVLKTLPAYTSAQPDKHDVYFNSSPGVPFAGYILTELTDPIIPKYSVRKLELLEPLEGNSREMTANQFKAGFTTGEGESPLADTLLFTTDFDEPESTNLLAAVSWARAVSTYQSPRTGVGYVADANNITMFTTPMRSVTAEGVVGSVSNKTVSNLDQNALRERCGVCGIRTTIAPTPLT